MNSYARDTGGEQKPPKQFKPEGLMAFDFEQDICERKHGGNENSARAHDRVKHSKHAMRERIWHLLNQNKLGMTSKEIAAHKDIDKPLNAISGRFKELRALGWIYTLNDVTRDGAALHIARERKDVLSEVQ